MHALFIFSISLCLFFTEQRLNAQVIDPVYAQVNKQHSLGNYKPKDLVKFEQVQISQRIVPDLKKLLKAAKRDGLQLRVVSGYRSFKKQERLFKSYIQKEQRKNKKLTQAEAEAEKKANSYSAKAGHSEHQLGTAVDILSSENNYQFAISGNLKYISWLEKNCSKFNFRISYPKNNAEYIYEPWHLRWYPSKR